MSTGTTTAERRLYYEKGFVDTMNGDFDPPSSGKLEIVYLVGRCAALRKLEKLNLPEKKYVN